MFLGRGCYNRGDRELEVYVSQPNDAHSMVNISVSRS